MRNLGFNKPKIVGEVGNMQFILFDGVKTKSFFNAAEFDCLKGVYPILNQHGQVIEYMDILGNFTIQPTKFAKDFNSYINSRNRGICYGCVENYVYFTTLLDFPSKYLINNKVRNIVKREELSKYKNACKNKQFSSLLDKLGYRLYISRIFNKKVAKAKTALKILNVENKNDDDFYLNV